MNIAFDAKRITKNTTGLGNYSRFIIRTLAEYSPENNYLLASFYEGNKALYEDLLTNRSVQMLFPKSKSGGAISEAIWRNWGLRKQLKEWDVDVYHGLSNEIPMGLMSKNRRIATVVTMHDLIFLHHPEYYNVIDRNLYKMKYLKSALNADRVIAISESTKRDLIEHVGVDEDKISIVYQGSSRSFSHIPQIAGDWAKKKFNLPSQFILFVGSIETRKNLALIVEALAKIKNKDICIVAVGKYTSYVDEVRLKAKRMGVENRLFILHNISNEDLPGIYKAASLFVYPSKYEGFGIPVIEAINASLPVIAATGSSLEEAGGSSSLYTDPNDSDMLADMIDRVLEDSELRYKMIKDGLNYVRRFSPKEINRALKDVYSKVMLR